MAATKKNLPSNVRKQRRRMRTAPTKRGSKLRFLKAPLLPSYRTQEPLRTWLLTPAEINRLMI